MHQFLKNLHMHANAKLCDPHARVQTCEELRTDREHFEKNVDSRDIVQRWGLAMEKASNLSRREEKRIGQFLKRGL